MSGALILASRAEHTRRLAEIEQAKVSAKLARTDAKLARTDAQPVLHEHVYACALCDYTTHNKNKYASHMRWVHGSRDK